MTPKTPPAQTGEPTPRTNHYRAEFKKRKESSDLIDWLLDEFEQEERRNTSLLTALREAKRETQIWQDIAVARTEQLEKREQQPVNLAGGSELAPRPQDAAVERDAMRYRWLRDGLAGMEVADHGIEVQELLLDADEMTAEQFDMALDAAVVSSQAAQRQDNEGAE